MKDHHTKLILQKQTMGVQPTLVSGRQSVGNDKRLINWMLDINNETAFPLKSNIKYTLNLIRFSES